MDIVGRLFASQTKTACTNADRIARRRSALVAGVVDDLAFSVSTTVRLPEAPAPIT